MGGGGLGRGLLGEGVVALPVGAQRWEKEVAFHFNEPHILPTQRAASPIPIVLKFGSTRTAFGPLISVGRGGA